VFQPIKFLNHFTSCQPVEWPIKSQWNHIKLITKGFVTHHTRCKRTGPPMFYFDTHQEHAYYMVPGPLYTSLPKIKLLAQLKEGCYEMNEHMRANKCISTIPLTDTMTNVVLHKRSYCKHDPLISNKNSKWDEVQLSRTFSCTRLAPIFCVIRGHVF
jgi:hypothetical protein